MRVNLPRLLTADMKERARLHPLEEEIMLNEPPPSTATMTIPRTDAAVALRDWVHLYTINGSAGIYRVTGVETSYDKETVYVTLEHGICALGDAIVNAEGTFEGSLDGLLGELLAYQVTEAGGAPLWVVGATVATASVRRDYNKPNLLTALTELVSQAGNVMLTFDQSALPWKLNLEYLTDTDACEGRFGRNLQSMTVDIDDTDMCTRVYIDGREGYRETDTVGLYGVISRVLNISEYAEEASAERYIADYMEAHKEPNVSIELDMLDMSEVTGESIDSMRLGRMCRACLPDYGVTVRNRIVGLRYPDVYGNPLDVRVSMGKRVKDLADLILEEQERSASTSSTVSRHYGSTSTSINNMGIELYKSKLELAEFQGQTVERFNEVYIDLDELNAEIVLKASQKDFNASLERLSSAEIRLDGAEASISLKASQTTVDELGERVSQAEIDIDGANSQITLKANKTVVDGILSTGLAGVSVLSATSVAGNRGNFDSLSINGDPIVQHSATVLKSVSISAPKTTFTDYYGDQYTVVASVSLNTSSETIVYLST